MANVMWHKDMKRRNLFASIKILLIVGAIGLVLIQMFLPPPSVESVLWYAPFFVVEYLLVLSGPIATIVVASSYLNQIHLAILLGIGVVSLLWWVYLLKIENNSRVKLSIPISIWIGVGVWSTFWGLAAGV